MMNMGQTIAALRDRCNLTQERFAELLGVSRQAVQKWESGAAKPDLNNVVMIAKLFNVSLDSLVLGSDVRICEELARDKSMRPEYDHMHRWELYSSELMTEYRQSVEEGKEIAAFEDLFKAVSRLPAGACKEQFSDLLFGVVVEAAQADDYEYIEPSDLEGIRRLRGMQTAVKTGSRAAVSRRKLEGAWVGRICGCLLGKPVEGIRTDELIPILRASGNFPMHRYILSTDITDDMCGRYQFRLKDRCYADTVSCAPVDDDTNYVVLAAQLIEKYGRSFTPADVSRLWLDSQPKNAYCTAERVAFRNFVNGFLPPVSATYKNPYREWIGAQIRGDYFGYINPGNPEAAAEMAWRDASISHVKNGIYGEMFVAAMLARAAECDDVEQVLLAGLSQIPTTSRLYERLTKTLEGYKNGVGEEACFADIHARYDEFDPHDWCHTLSNAEIVAASLLYGGGDFGRSVCRAVQTGFDTDCNGATVGSVLGMMGGIESIGESWTKPVNGELDTSIFGVGRVRIDDLVDMTVRHIEMV